VTGVYDARTRRAVRAFQRRHGLTVDGIVGPQTLSALGLVSRRRTRRTSKTLSSVLERIAQCESGGNPSAVSSSGQYRGQYQFDRATWSSLGGTGDAAQAPESEQDRLSAQLYRERGASAWPNCA